MFVYKIHGSRAYVFYSLYIYTEHRNNGYGEFFLNHSCDYIKSLGAKKIYIQPGSFEIVDNRICKPDDETKKNNDKKLLRFYKRCGFKIAGKAARKIASMVYSLMKIDENADFLMVNNLRESR